MAGINMKLFLFFKLFLISLAISLAAFALTPNAGLMFLAKAIALGTGLSIVLSLVYPELRGVKQGDVVAVVISNARKNNELRVRFDNGEEAVGIVESYSGLFSPPKVRIIYEERIVE